MKDALRRALGVGLAASLVILALSFAVPMLVDAQATHDSNASVAPAAEAAALVEHDTNLISPPCRSLYIGGTGNVVVDMARTGTDITYLAVPVGTILPIRVKRFKTASTATGICLY